MKITGYKTTVVSVPYEAAITGSHVLLQLNTDDGIEGIGYVSRIRPPALKPLVSALEVYLDQIKGHDPLNIEALYGRVFNRGGGLPGFTERAWSLIDVALWDISGKAAGRPVYQLMGGFRDRVPCYASWRIEEQDSESLAKSGREHVDQGFRAMKYHTGSMDGAAVVEHMRMLRDAVGPDIDIMVDVNQKWTIKQTIAMAKALARYNPYWIEDPVPLDDYEGVRQVRDNTETLICAGEVYRTIPQFRHLLVNRAVDVAMIDLDVGMSGFLKIAHMAEVFGIPVVTHLATEIMAQGVAGVANGLTVEYYPWAAPLWKEPLHLDDDGMLVMPDKPGFGLELDEAAVSKYAVR
ncbi:MAG TPA: mandelate racemase/muconate lactonizing enzyme family protein [Dehalococcoidia bacterium]|nr:mandelate racemase/muconate lactonizing enzyme family protein [Dehalococcoidia bacterium]